MQRTTPFASAFLSGSGHLEHRLYAAKPADRKTFPLHRDGARDFSSGFGPSGRIEVGAAALEIGLLKADLPRAAVPADARVIEINSGGLS